MPDTAQNWLSVDIGHALADIAVLCPDGAVIGQSRVRAQAPMTPAQLAALVKDARAAWPLTPAGPVVVCGAMAGPDARSVPCTPLPDVPVATACDDAPGVMHVIPELVDAGASGLRSGGAETRAAGFLAWQPQFDGVLCVMSAGTTLWMQVSAGEVVSFRGFLTLRMGAALGPQLGVAQIGATGAQALDAAQVADTASQTLSRPEALMTRLSQLPSGAAGEAVLLGALIGAEMAAARPWWLGQSVALIAPDGAAGNAYAAALGAQGGAPVRVEEGRMARLGLGAAHAALSRG